MDQEVVSLCIRKTHEMSLKTVLPLIAELQTVTRQRRECEKL